jgi:hypothetical protein
MKTITKKDTVHLNSEGQFHCLDGPAIIRKDGTMEWYTNGVRHRNGGPAIFFEDGTKVWFKDGLRHREDGPAIEHADGTVEWRYEGKIYFTMRDFCQRTGKSEQETMLFILKYPDDNKIDERAKL